MRFGLFQPFNMTVRLALWILWAVIALSVVAVGSRSPEPNHPVGLLLLGAGLAVPGVLALLALVSSTFWSRLVDPGELDVQKVKLRIHGLVGLGLVGFVMVWSALDRLL